MKKVIIFVNSYFEYVKLKSFLEKVNASVQFSNAVLRDL